MTTVEQQSRKQMCKQCENPIRGLRIIILNDTYCFPCYMGEKAKGKF